jgi:RNA polymerase sigma-70 factor (ECF subfamily)
MKKPPSPPKKQAGLSDEDIIARVLAGEVDLFELLMRRHNQLVFRIGRAVLRDNAKAEDLAQEAWARAFEHLDQFAGKARFSTWLSRIALHEAWARVRRDRRFDAGELPTKSASGRPNPESAAFAGEVRSLLEAAIDVLPDGYRVVLMLSENEVLK